MEDLVEVVWHSACYSSYTSKRNLQFASSIDTNDAASEEECEDQERESRSSRSKIDWSKPEVDEETAKKGEAFICNLYPSYKKSAKTTDELRHIIFCQKKPNSEALPPTSDSFFSLSRHCRACHHDLPVVPV